MTVKQMESTVYDICAERNRVWSDAESLVTRITNSNFCSEILADFIADLACGDGLDQCDPIQLLTAHASRWDNIGEDDEEVEFIDDDDFV